MQWSPSLPAHAQMAHSFAVPCATSMGGQCLHSKPPGRFRQLGSGGAQPSIPSTHLISKVFSARGFAAQKQTGGDRIMSHTHCMEVRKELPRGFK